MRLNNDELRGVYIEMQKLEVEPLSDPTSIRIAVRQLANAIKILAFNADKGKS